MKKEVKFDDLEIETVSKINEESNLEDLAKKYPQTHKSEIEKIANERKENLTISLPASIRKLFIDSARKERYSQTAYMLYLMRKAGLKIPKGLEDYDRRRKVR